MVRKTTLLGLVVLGCLVPLPFTPKALGQPVISVRDPQTGRRYVADPMQESRSRLERTSIDLRLRVDALNTQSATLTDRAAEIRAMPGGIGRDAAITGFNRDLSAWRERRDQYNLDRLRFLDDVKSFNQLVEEQNRRVQAARNANQFRVGQSVRVEWQGQWWDASILRAEGGSYYVTYTGYGREWDEWVAPGRIRRR
jgi:RNA binding activity-knot of a chromodomain